MKIAWLILGISAITDAANAAMAGMLGAMTATGNATMPNKATVIVMVLSGGLAFCRTVQQALKASPEIAAALKGQPAANGAK